MKIFIHDEERAYVRGAFHLQHVFGTEYRNVLDEQKYTEIISRLISQSNPNFKSFLDVGCGGGHLLKALSQRFPAWEFRGIDPVYSDGSIEHGDLFSSDVRTADVVLLKEVIQHVNRLDYGLYCASKLLNPGGLLIIVDRNPRSFLGFRKPIFEALGRWMYPADSPFSERWYSASCWRQFLGRLGQIVHFETLNSQSGRWFFFHRDNRHFIMAVRMTVGV